MPACYKNLNLKNQMNIHRIQYNENLKSKIYAIWFSFNHAKFEIDGTIHIYLN